MAGKSAVDIRDVYMDFRVRGTWAHGGRPAVYITEDRDEAQAVAADMASKGARVTVYERDDWHDWLPAEHVGVGRNEAWAQRRNAWLTQRREAIRRSRADGRRRERRKAGEQRTAERWEASLRQAAIEAAGPHAAGPEGSGRKGSWSVQPR